MQELPFEDDDFDNEYYDDELESSPRLFIIIITVVIGLLLAVIGIIIFVSSPPADTSTINITYEQNDGVVRLFHEGGESVPFSSLKFRLSGQIITPASIYLEGGGSDYAIGKTIKINNLEKGGLFEILQQKEDKEILVFSKTLNSSLPVPTIQYENLTTPTKATPVKTIFVNSTITPVYERTPGYTLYAFDTKEAAVYHLRETFAETRAIPTIIPPVKIPLISFSPKNGNAPLTVQFNSNAIENDQVYWDFGDGRSGTEYNPSHTYESPGLYSVRFSLTDLYGRENTMVFSDSVSVLSYALTDVLITAESGAYVKKDGLIRFRVNGEGSSIKVGGRLQQLNTDDEVELMLIENEYGTIKAKESSITGFSFPDVRVCINDQGCAHGLISDINIKSCRIRLSTLTLIIPAGVRYEGRVNMTSISGISQNLTFFSLKPDTSGEMVLEAKEGSRLYYKGGVGDSRGQ